MKDLNANLDKLHTTDLGVARIRRNLNLQNEDVVMWCKESLQKADVIIGLGKNWYVYYGGVVITIHANSYTIITAHKINPKVRVMQQSDYACLPEFLYQAIFIPDGVEPPPRDIINEPDISVYIKNFETQLGDLGVKRCQVP